MASAVKETAAAGCKNLSQRSVNARVIGDKERVSLVPAPQQTVSAASGIGAKGLVGPAAKSAEPGTFELPGSLTKIGHNQRGR